MGQPFIGSEARAAGTLGRHELRRFHTAIMPNVYLEKGVTPTLRRRTEAAWLWSQRESVVSGLAASALHGAKWVDDDATVELICSVTPAFPGRRPRSRCSAPTAIRATSSTWRMLTVEYDGDQHRTSRPQFVKDVERLEYITSVGWTHIKVLAEHRGYDVVRRVRQSWDALRRK